MGKIIQNVVSHLLSAITFISLPLAYTYCLYQLFFNGNPLKALAGIAFLYVSIYINKSL